MALRQARLLTSLSQQKVSQFVSSFDTVLSDCDEVIWEERKALKGSVETLNRLQDMGKKLFLVTNNSAYSTDQYINKCGMLGLQIKREEIVSSALVAAQYVKKRIPNSKKAYVIGSSGLYDELSEAGVPNFGFGPDHLPTESLSQWMKMGVQLESDVGAVVIGFDCHFSYLKLLKAATYLTRSKDCVFVTTNKEGHFQAPGKIMVPGCGALSAAVEVASGRKTEKMGKPFTHMLEHIRGKHNLQADRTIMIGDRADTDVMFGHNCGFRTLLVLTGVTKLQEIEKWKKSVDKDEQELIPDYYIESLGHLLPYLSNTKG